MAPSGLSSLSSTSHTMSADPHPPSLPALLSSLSVSPHDFIQPSSALHSAALTVAKSFLDPLASATNKEQRHRQQHIRKKRKLGEAHELASKDRLQLNQIYLDGFGVDQIWEQARRVLDATSREVESSLPNLHGDTAQNGQQKPTSELTAIRQDGLELMEFDEDGFEIGTTSEGSGTEDDAEDPEALDNSAEVSEISEGFEENGEGLEADNESGSDEGDVNGDNAKDVFKPDPNGLNDGFFSIDDFNKQSEFLERQDELGDPYDGAASDEEDIDWEADPLNQPKAARAQSEKQDNENEDQDGPTFGDMDIFAPEGDSEAESDDEDDSGANANGAGDNANDIRYDDFFAPPPRKVGKNYRPSKKNGEKHKPASKPEVEDDNLARTIDAVRRDLLDDDLSQAESDVDLSDPAASGPGHRQSAHERRQSKLAAEIRKLEAANVAKREWTLSGEARASDRPLNSLLEEDLDFERTGKPVPVITAEVSEDIEQMIKRRILALEFDEVIRRRPDSLDLPTAPRRGRTELDDDKPQQSLAQIYEEDHMRKIDPEGVKDQKSEKLKKEHEELENLWADVSAKLDALSSWHYKPKPPKPSVAIVADVPTISMEDARPTAAVGTAELGASSMLAAQEVYTPGKDKEVSADGEVVPKSGIPVSRDEMSREEKLRRRRRDKERLKKKLGGKMIEHKGEGRKKTEKNEVVDTLRKGGVKVIGKKGDLRDVEGRKAREIQVSTGGGNFKL